MSACPDGRFSLRQELGFVDGLSTLSLGRQRLPLSRPSPRRPRVNVTSSASAISPSSARLLRLNELRSSEKLFFDPTAGLRAASQSSAEHLYVVYAYPSVYEVGICSLGYQVIWAALAAIPGVGVARLFTDAMDRLPAETHLLGFSLSWELDYVGIFEQLMFTGVPRHAVDRGEDDPIVFGGGPVLTANPEPWCAFFDVILLGDGEDVLPEFVEAVKQHRGTSRRTVLRELSKIPGVYVPTLYEVKYESPTGPVVSVTPVDSDVPATIQKATYRGKSLAASTVVTPHMAWENIFMVEAVRSCPAQCAFCLASYVTLPFRASPVEDHLLPTIDSALWATNRIGILGASVTQHPQFDEFLLAFNDKKYDDVRLSISSMRTNTVTEELARTLVAHDSKSITIAVESGSERLRKIINKQLSNDEIVEAAQRAQAGGLSSLKLYGMAGLPGEVEEDHDETIAMFEALHKSVGKGPNRLRLTFGCSTFVPKGHTPMQWFGMHDHAGKRMKRLGKHLGRLGVEFRPESHKKSQIQALLSRGDRRISRVLELVSGYGDSLGSFRRAFKDLKGTVPAMDYYVREDWGMDTVLPWAHLRTALTPEKIADARFDAEAHFRPESTEFSRVSKEGAARNAAMASMASVDE
jgi:radical SAM superfamily enzyme YgiQ (UPF0313 family)